MIGVNKWAQSAAANMFEGHVYCTEQSIGVAYHLAAQAWLSPTSGATLRGSMSVPKEKIPEQGGMKENLWKHGGRSIKFG